MDLWIPSCLADIGIYHVVYTIDICDFFDSPQTKAVKKTEVRDILEGSLSGERRQASLGLG